MTEDTPYQDLPTDRHQRGDEIFRRLMGTPPPQGLDPFTYDHVYGDLWARQDLDVRARRIVTIVATAMCNAELPLKSHLSAALRTGAFTIEELREIGLQMGHYGGLALGVCYQVALGAVEASVKAETAG